MTVWANKSVESTSVGELRWKERRNTMRVSARKRLLEKYDRECEKYESTSNTFLIVFLQHSITPTVTKEGRKLCS